VPRVGTFDVVEKVIVNKMRSDCFPSFLKSDVCRELEVAKSQLPKAIMVENEFGMEELAELDELRGVEGHVKLNIARRTTKNVKVQKKSILVTGEDGSQTVKEIEEIVIEGDGEVVTETALS